MRLDAMPIDAATIWETVKTKGLGVAAAAVLSGITVGVVDHLTTGIIPFISQNIKYAISPPKFFIGFTEPVTVESERAAIRILDLDNDRPVEIKTRTNRRLTVQAPPGSYEIRIVKTTSEPQLELYAQLKIDTPGSIAPVDTASAKWASVEALKNSLGPAPADEPRPSGTLTSDTRWSVSQLDLAATTGVVDERSAAILSTALGEVGTYEKGSRAEKQRVLDYLRAAGLAVPADPDADVSSIPWGGAFVGWLVKQAGAVPPEQAAAYRSWLNWGRQIPEDQLKPGMIAIFRLSGEEIPQARSRLLVGAVLRRRPGCIEVIVGNIVDRVAITCVRAPLLSLRQADPSGR